MMNINNVGAGHGLFAQYRNILQGRGESGVQSMAADMVSVSRPSLLSDEEAALAVQSVQSMAQESPSNLLSAHQGLTLSSVMSLLEDI